jgi:hypothetical protein
MHNQIHQQDAQPWNATIVLCLVGSGAVVALFIIRSGIFISQVAELRRLTGKKLPKRLCRNGVHEEYDTDIKSPREG